MADTASMASVSVVVTDLDGTLWHFDDHIDPAVLDAWAELERRGIPVLVATGRRVTSTRVPLGRFGLAPEAIVLNGALGLDLATGERFHRAPFSAEGARGVLDAMRAAGLSPVVYIDHPELDAFVGPDPSTHPDHLAGLGDGARPDDLDRVVAEETVLGFSMIGVAFDDAERAEQKIAGTAETHVDRSIDYDGLASMTIAPLGQSKWDGVLAWCRARDVDPTRVLALADGANDLELLDGAAIGLVPEVCHPAARSRASAMIPSAADGGWAAVLDHVG